MPTMRALQITKPHELEVVTVEQPEPGPHEALIKVMASGICGTDIHILEGEYMGKYPIIPGHEFAGVVVKTGDKVSRIRVGDRVAAEPNVACDNCQYCLNNQQNFCEKEQAIGVTLPGGMAEYVIAPEKTVYDIGNLEFEEGAFVEPLSCVLHGLGKLPFRLGDRVAILGAGPIGIIFLQAMKAQGAQSVAVVETDQGRADLAAASGADEIYRTLDDLPREAFDVVIDATGVIPVMNRTPELAKKGGNILLFGVPPKANVEFNAFNLFLKGLTIFWSYTSVRNSIQAIDVLKSKRIDVRKLVSHRLPLEEFATGVRLIQQKQENVAKIIITPHG